MKVRLLLLALVSGLVLMPGQGLAAGQGAKQPPDVKIKHGDIVTPAQFTGSLKDLPKPTNKPLQKRPEVQVDFGTGKVGSPAAPVQRPALSMPAASASFEGLDFAGGGSAGWPPDTVGDVGPNHYVEAVNAAFADPAPSGPCSPYRRPFTSSR